MISCMDSIETCTSEKISQEELCQSPSLKFACRKTCGLCVSETAASPKLPVPVQPVPPIAHLPVQPVNQIPITNSVPVQTLPVSQPVVQYARNVAVEPPVQFSPPQAVQPNQPVSSTADKPLGCLDAYPELCKLKANANSCQNKNLWRKCGASCNRCSETTNER